MMIREIVQTLKEFNWRQWLVLAAFLFIIGFTGHRAYLFARDAIYWHYHQDEQIRGWMNVDYVAHSYRVPPHVLYQALDLPHRPPDRRPLSEIAREQHRSMDEVRAILQDAIIHARPPYPPPPPPDKGGPP
ncbi:MAG: hypothetical protein AUG51_14095 [Acidobacteria bacterium 13_1_20CM_3_53_8]|nr:MAG: hypothetical protein AUG51_14095 [Acidobacteria bacterium 13_1_20CM_3_53_8]